MHLHMVIFSGNAPAVLLDGTPAFLKAIVCIVCAIACTRNVHRKIKGMHKEIESTVSSPAVPGASATSAPKTLLLWLASLHTNHPPDNHTTA